MSSTDQLEYRQEPERVSGKTVVGVMAAVAVVIVLTVGVILVMLARAEPEVRDVLPAEVDERISGLEQRPFPAMARGQELRRRDERVLEEYGWVDERRDIARIPIGRAMEWIVLDAERGELTQRRERRRPTSIPAGVDGAHRDRDPGEGIPGSRGAATEEEE